MFVDGNFAAIEGSQLFLVVVHHDHIVAKVGKTSPCDQADVSRTDYRDLHLLIPLEPWTRITTLHKESLLYQREFVGGKILDNTCNRFETGDSVVPPTGEGEKQSAGLIGGSCLSAPAYNAGVAGFIQAAHA